MEIPSSDMLGPRPNFGFAFDDIDFCDRVLHIELMADSLDSKSDSERCNLVPKIEKSDMDKGCILMNSECSSVPEVRTLNISSVILAANSPFFYKLFKNGMKESQQKEATLRINNSEAASLMELLSFMYNNTLTATTIPDLLGVLVIADKFEVTSCIRYSSALLQQRPISLESALLYLALPPSVSVTEFVQPLIDAAKKWLVEHFNDINKSQEEAMTLPLFAFEVVLGSETLQWDSKDDIFEFILKWARVQYPDLEVRREILTKRLTQFIPFPYMSCSKLREVLICPDFDHEEVSKLVNEALFFKVEHPYGQFIHPSVKCQLIKVEQFELSQPRCVVHFDIKKEECENLQPNAKIRSTLFHLGGRCFCLDAKYYYSSPYGQQKSFALFLSMTKESNSCTLDFEFAVIKKSSKEFQTVWKGQVSNSQLREGYGYPNLFGISWNDFMSNNSDYFIDGILHLRADLTVNNAQA